MALHKAASIMKKRGLDSKNYARVGPEGQTKTGSATVCNAGFPPYGQVFMITRLIEQGKYEEKKKKRKDRNRRGTRQYIYHSGSGAASTKGSRGMWEGAKEARARVQTITAITNRHRLQISHVIT